MNLTLVLVLASFLVSCRSDYTLVISPDSATVLINATANFIVNGKNIQNEVDIFLKVDSNIAKLDHAKDTISDEKPASFIITGNSPGHALVNATAGNTTVFFHLTIQHSHEWSVFSDVIGWIYFVAWSISFYPQIYDNWKRKSVIGLNLDFLALNLMGFFLYSLFNAGMFWIEEIRQEYLDDRPGSINPVLINDIFFSFHAFIAVVLTIIQCFLYERGDQTVSLTGKAFLGIFTLFLVISAICCGAGALTWLQFLYFCSYVKLAITLIKYIPQAYMNYKRKSTIGWSIGNVFLDFTGGVLSMLQMIVNSWNYDDWGSIMGDPTKFGLGLFSVVFDVFFFIQHYIWYRHVYADILESSVAS